eukprot:COSAG04_NODE_1742_length_5722_cov_23.916593_3_plen_120_part_00
MDDKNVSDKLSFRYLPQVSQDLLGGRFPLGRTMRNGSREPWGAAQYGLDDSVGSVLGHGRPYGFGTDRLVKFQTGEPQRLASAAVETRRPARLLSIQRALSSMKEASKSARQHSQTQTN